MGGDVFRTILARKVKAALTRRSPYGQSFDERHMIAMKSIAWPHAPMHRLSEAGTYFVTAGTYLKAHHFRTM